MRSELAKLAILSFALATPAEAVEEAGEVAFNTHCRNCHSVKKSDNRLGPSLHGIVGKPAGKVEGFANYSGGLAGITWDEGTLDKFISNPTSVATNTTMNYPPVKEAEVRKKIIAYLKDTGRS